MTRYRWTEWRLRLEMVLAIVFYLLVLWRMYH